MEKVLVIVESPAKARTISRYLGPSYMVESSIGHVRDLPATAAEIPARYKDQPWARLSVNVEDNFKPLYVVPSKKKAQVSKLRARLKEASALYLATDEDREGEAIAWHLVAVLKPKVPIRRMVFHEITEKAIAQAVENPREIDQRLVNAQETRRVLDRLVGWEVSPLLWRKVKPKLSAGRVQSVAIRMAVVREQMRIRFVQAEYWNVEAKLAVREGKREQFPARLTEVGGRRVASGKDFDDSTGQIRNPEKVVLLGKEEANAICGELQSAELEVAEIVEKPFVHRPYPPFITSTLQQEAGRKLRFSARRTMRTAQSLYENGYITYMRTDSPILSEEAINAAREQVRELYGDQYLPAQPRTYARTSKTAQEAHEAIRPAGESFRTPGSIKDKLDADQFRVYELIWKRTVASQMKDARGQRTTVRIQAAVGEWGRAGLNASGRVLEFAGFLRAYVAGSDDPGAELADQEKLLPPLVKGQILDPAEIAPVSHSTQPPARYTEASLIKELESRGIGRPSTYASIIETILDRGYAWRKGAALVPTFTAFAVVNLLVQHLAELVDYDFTAKMEEELDTIASGQREAGPWLHEFYFGKARSAKSKEIVGLGLKGLVSASIEEADPRLVSRISLGTTAEGDEVVVRVGRFGPYLVLGDKELRASVPEDMAPDEITPAKAVELMEKAAQGNTELGVDPDTGKPVYVKNGRFGTYVQLGDPELNDKGKVKRGGKPKMASLWPSMSSETLTLDEALMLLAFPREVGLHPESGEAISALDGRFGPYLKMGSDSRSLTSHEQLSTITLDEAVALFKQPKGRRKSQTSVLAELGQHPESGVAIQTKSGRYGVYVTDGVVNATVPKAKDPDSLTLPDALLLLAAREQKLRDQGKDPRAPKAKGRRRAKKSS